MGEREDLQRLSRFSENVAWFMDSYDKFKAHYPDEYVAVCDSAIVDHDRDVAKLVERLKKAKNYDRCAIEFVSSQSYELIL